MFDNFTFGAVSQTRHDEVTASPTDMSFATPQTSFPFSPNTLEDLSDIVQQFSKQSLTRTEREKEFAAWGDALNCPLEVDSDDDMSSPAPTTTTTTTSIPIPTPSPHAHSASVGGGSGGGLACRRMQRQLNTQLQLSTSHMRDLNTLVEHMISSNSQCRLQPRSSQACMRGPVPIPLHDLAVDPADNGGVEESLEIDEGFCEAERRCEDEMSLRNAGAPSGIRKYGPMTWGRSSDACVGGRAKVRSRPRMRRRCITK